MPFAAVHDIRMYYEIRGAGPRLLYISGTGGDLRRSPNAFDSPLAEHFEVLAYDQRGLGQTDKPDVAYTMAGYAADADGLLHAVGWDQCLVMGISFGGMVAQEFALRYPNRVQRLVLGCTSSGGEGGASYPLHELSQLSAQDWARRVVELSDLRRDAVWQAANVQEFQTLTAEMQAIRTGGADEPGKVVGARRQIEARQEHDTYTRLPQLRMPVLICGGQYDGVAPVENQEALCRQIAAAQMALFEGGHLFFTQDPRAFEDIIVFLKGGQAA